MSSNVLGRRVSRTALEYEGCKTGDKYHRHLVDVFNREKPNGQVAYYSSNWCAIFWTACQLMAGMKHEDVPMGYNVPQLVEEAKRKGIWVENDKHVPRKGDGIVYDWQDNGKGDNRGNPDHIGIVYKVTKSKIYVIEGNTTKRKEDGTPIDTGVSAKRQLQINGTYIRGFICPRYNAIYIDKLARTYAYKKGTDKRKYAWNGGKACMSYRTAWKKYFPNKTLNADCHKYVMLVMKTAGYRTMPLSWSNIIAYMKERCDLVSFNYDTSKLRKGDIYIYKRIDSKGKAHYHIRIIVKIDGKLAIAEANHRRYYAHINTNLNKLTKHYSKVWVFRPKEVA